MNCQQKSKYYKKSALELYCIDGILFIQNLVVILKTMREQMLMILTSLGYIKNPFTSKPNNLLTSNFKKMLVN